MKKDKKIIITLTLIIIVIISISAFFIYKFDSFTLEILEIYDNCILGKSIKNDKYYLVYIDLEQQVIYKNFHKIDITNLEEGNVIYVLNETPEIKDSLATVTTDGHFIDDRLNNIKLITFLKETSES